MAKGAHRSAAKDRHWRRLLDQGRQSGLSIRAFGVRYQRAEARFYFWRRTLPQRDGNVAAAPAQGTTPSRGSRVSTRPAVTFLPVQVVPDDRSSARSLDVILGNGRRLRVGAAFDCETLVRLVAALEDRPC